MFYEIFITLIILGAIFGSFANVCIYRLPKEQSVVTKGSYCPNCKKKINWLYNIPLFSYLCLKGKCKNCKKKIPIQYLIVEIISALSFAAIYYFFGYTIETLLLIFIFFLYLIIFFIDLKHYIIPNSLNYILIISGFIKNFIPEIDEFLFTNLISSILGGIFLRENIVLYFLNRKFRKLKRFS